MDIKIHAKLANDCTTKNTARIIEIGSYSAAKNTARITQIKYRSGKRSIIRIIKAGYYSAAKNTIKLIEAGYYSATKNTIRITEIKQEQKALAKEQLNATLRHHGRIKQLSKQSMQKHCGFKTSHANPTM